MTGIPNLIDDNGTTSLAHDLNKRARERTSNLVIQSPYLVNNTIVGFPGPVRMAKYIYTERVRERERGGEMRESEKEREKARKR